MSDGKSTRKDFYADKVPHTTTTEPVSAIPLLAHALTKIRSTPPRIITSPPTQPRRAAVALVIRVVPPKSFPQISPYQAQPTLQEFFQLDWVNAPGAIAEVLFLKRENPGEDAVAIANNRVNNSLESHVAFPGGRTEEGDEGGCYTGVQLLFEMFPMATNVVSVSYAANLGRDWFGSRRTRFHLRWTARRQGNHNLPREASLDDPISVRYGVRLEPNNSNLFPAPDISSFKQSFSNFHPHPLRPIP